eukprot:CAMPEP_0173279082 /NCGR_PEP_ID=MMETSP1143-20121109/4958_1 /TAXON_ID=483371 /ORGANISM="non described non described, Strain CCMP2298" /LENGTH=135 /DNA_ID=CAMNT_0014216285 /DNA_START=228 /DNA_END=635 /DNA_ORIENTATION=-
MSVKNGGHMGLLTVLASSALWDYPSRRTLTYLQNCPISSRCPYLSRASHLDPPEAHPQRDLKVAASALSKPKRLPTALHVGSKLAQAWNILEGARNSLQHSLHQLHWAGAPEVQCSVQTEVASKRWLVSASAFTV